MTVDLRCKCGALLMRAVGRKVEIKCRRCKRLVVIPLVDGSGGHEARWTEVPCIHGVRSSRSPPLK